MGDPRHGMDLKKALKRFQKLGGKVEPINRTGEVRCSCDVEPHPWRVNVRRKDAPRILTGAIIKMEEGRR